MAHHVLCGVMMCCGLFGGMTITKSASLGLLCEITQPCLNYRFMLQELDQFSPPILCNNILFLVSYTVFRILYFPCVAY